MATILFSAIGTALGGPLGGAIGALVGSRVDSAIIGNGSVAGPRLKELEVTTSSYGAAIPRHFGRMRVPGSIIWATDLVETSETEGGKNRPDVTTYSYSVSFAVALASRPITDIGRIWADGKLMRGEAGDLKVGGELRLYTGEDDQLPDPLIAAAEGEDLTPAFRGIAYAVFENLDLTEYYNRMPVLTFEVFAGEQVSLLDVVGEVIEDVDADVPLVDLAGFTFEGPIIDAMRQIAPIYPLSTDAAGDLLTIDRARLQGAPIALPEAAISVDDDDFGGPSGFARRRGPPPEQPPEVLRYYDLERDYQPGIQRANGRPGPGQPGVLEIAAAMSAANAKKVAEQVKRRSDWSRDRVAWRTCELDPPVAPGSLVSLPGRSGRWRVSEWEWRANGVELGLERVVPTGPDSAPGGNADAGNFAPPEDLAVPPTSLAAFELPWDGTGSADTVRTYAAVSASTRNWPGAALYVDPGTGELVSLGPSGRTRAISGVAETALAPANPLLFDRHSSLDVALVTSDLNLIDATARQIASGWNRLLVGSEIIQFMRAQPLGNGRWRLSALLRGRGGTEAATGNHAIGERVVLLDGRPVLLDQSRIGTTPDTTILAGGRAEPDPVAADIALRGIALKPLCPVHPRIAELADGSLQLCWTRRARGAWQWLDGVETPLHEEIELYRVTFGPVDVPVSTWEVSAPVLVIPPAQRSSLATALPTGSFAVRQQGSYAVSDPLLIGTIP